MSKAGASRRKSSADGPGGDAPEPEPATAAAARRLVGRRVEKVFRDDALGKYRPFRGEVTEVLTSAQRADGTVDPRFYYYVRYEDGDSEHMLWSELSTALLPPGAEDDEEEPAAAAAKAGGKNKGSNKQRVKSEAGAAEAQEDEAAAGKKPAAAGKKRRGSTGGGAAAADNDAAAPAAANATTTNNTNKRARKGAKTATTIDPVDADNAAAAAAAAAALAGSEDGAAPAADGDAPTLSAGGAVAGADDGEEAADAANDDGGEGAIAGIDARVRARGLPGHLRRVRLRNFMCHANFEMEFGAHVNVVSGTNGSGKSAVLQAVQACLGASAKVTGRATSMGDFVRTGSDEALVSVELWNAGEDGYDRQRLGDSVTIERRIAAGTGSSQWRVLDSRGRVVATGPAAKKRLIDPLLDHLSVNAANPMAAMTQDTARTFLSSGQTGPQRRFELFMEATMLALFKSNLDAARSYASQMASRVEEVLKDHQERVGRKREAERKLALLDEAKEAALNRGPLERAAAWAVAAEGQAKVRALRKYVDLVLPAKIEMLRTGRAAGLKELDGLNKEVASLKDRQTKATALADRFSQAESKQSRLLKKCKDDVSTCATDLKEARKELREAEAELKRHRQATAEATAGQRAALAPQMASQEQGREAQERRLRELTEAREEKENAVEAARKRLEQLRDELRSAEQSAITKADLRERAAAELTEARASAKDPLAPYRTRALRLRIDELEAAGRSAFKKPPIGPLGAHVAAADQGWHLAMSAVVQQTLDFWIVDNGDDAAALQRLAQEVYLAHANVPQNKKPPMRVQQVYVRPYSGGAARYSIGPEHRPAAPYASALDALNITHPTHANLIFNTLVDTTSLERVALVDDKAAADRAVGEGKAGAACSMAVDKTGRVLQRHGPSVTSAREFAMAQGAPRLRVVNRGTEQTVAALEAQQEEAARRAEAAKRRSAELKEEVEGAEAEFTALDIEYRDARTEEQKARRALAAQVTEIQETQRLMDMPLDDDDDDDDDDNDQAGGGGGGGGGGAGAGTANAAVARKGKALSKAADEKRSQVDSLERALTTAKEVASRAEAAMEAALTNLRSEGGLLPDEIVELVDTIKEIDDKRKQLQDRVNKMESGIARLEKELKDTKPVADAAERDLLPPLLEAARAVCDDAQGALDLVRGKEICFEAARRRLDAEPSKRIQRMTPEEKSERARKEANDDFDAEWLLQHLDALDERVREAENEAGGTREELAHERDMLRLEIRRQAVVVRNLRNTNEAVQTQVTRRSQAYADLFKSVEQTVRHKFELFMARRHHTGTIRINRDRAELNILVVPNGARGARGAGGGGRTAQAARDLRQLSGGERSFTTVAFMLALGEWTESPFRAADELDVFMDAVNRRVAMEAVLEFAAERDHLQMILLTPQDLQAVEDAKASLARRRARRARQARKQQQQEEEMAAGGGGGGRGGGRGRGAQAPPPQDEDDDDVDEAEEAAAALPEGFVRVLKMPAAREAGGVRRQQQAMAAAGGQ